MKKDWFYKDLEVYRDRPIKPIPYMAWIIAMLVVFGFICLFDKCGIIKFI